VSLEESPSVADQKISDATPVEHSKFDIRILFFLSIFAGLIVIMFLLKDFRPLFDGAVYLSCITRAVSQSFNILNFRCVDHTSIAYLLLLSIAQYLVPHSTLFVFVINVLLATCTSVALCGILRIVTRAEPLETCLTTAIFVFSPVYVAHIFEVTLDFGLVSFFTIYIFLLLKRSYIFASLFAIAMSFTKETGIALYLGCTIIYFLIIILMNDLRWNEKIAAMKRARILIFPGLVLLIYYFLLARIVPSDKLFWQAGKMNLPHLALNFNITCNSMLAYFANLFILNFSWIFTIFLLLSLFFAFLRTSPRISMFKQTNVSFIIWIFIFSIYLVTRINFSYSNVARYVLVAYVLLVILFHHAQHSIIKRAKWRVLLLYSALSLILVSNFRTIDPLSKQVFGTFSFGKHQILSMNRFIGINIDASVYNLEFTYFYYLVNLMVNDMNLEHGSVVFTGERQGIWWPVTHMNNGATSRYSIKLIDNIEDMNPESLSKKYSNPQNFFYIEFPNLNNTNNLKYLLNNYKLIGKKQYDISGYQLKGYIFQMRS